MNSSDIDVERMSKEEAIPVSLIKEALGIAPLVECPAATLKEALEICIHAPRGSQKQRAALTRYLSLCSTPQDVREVRIFFSTDAEANMEIICKLATFYVRS